MRVSIPKFVAFTEPRFDFGSRHWRHDVAGQCALALNPLLLAVDGRFDAARGARIFPRHLAERGAGGLLLLQRRQRLSEPQQGIRGFRRFVEFGGHREKGFGGVAILLALEEALAQPVLRIRRSGDRSDIFARSCAWSLRPAHSPCAAYSRCRDRTRPSASPTAAKWSSAPVALVLRGGGAASAGLRRVLREIERLACVAPAGRADRRFGRDRELAAAERARRAGGIRILVGIEGIATAPAWRRRHACRLLDDRRRSGDLRLIAGLGRRLPIGRIRLRRRQRGDIGLGDGGRRSAGSALGAALKQPQALFELPVAILQFLVLAGELPQLILELLNPHLRIDIVGLRQRRRRRTRPANTAPASRRRRGAGNFMKSG